MPLAAIFSNNLHNLCKKVVSLITDVLVIIMLFEILFSLKRFKSFTQCQLGKVLPHNMFLLSDRRMPSRPECRRSTRGVVSSDRRMPSRPECHRSTRGVVSSDRRMPSRPECRRSTRGVVSSDRRMPSRPECHRSTRGVVSWPVALALRHQQQRHRPVLFPGPAELTIYTLCLLYSGCTTPSFYLGQSKDRVGRFMRPRLVLARSI